MVICAFETVPRTRGREQSNEREAGRGGEEGGQYHVARFQASLVLAWYVERL